MRHAHLLLLALLLPVPLACDGGDDGETTSDSDGTTGTGTDGTTGDTTTDGTGTDGGSGTAGGSTGGGSTGGGVMGEPCDLTEATCGDGTFHCIQFDINDAMGVCLPPCAAGADCDSAGFDGYQCCTITFNSEMVCIPTDATVDGISCG